MTNLTYSASVSCADLGNLEHDLNSLADAGCDELHFAIMDGSFTPDISLGIDFIKMAKERCCLPCDAFLAVDKPERFINKCVEAGADTVTIPIEACMHIHRAITQIRDAGVSPGIALNPGTPLTKIEYLLNLVDRVLLMNVEPGYSAQKISSNSYERVRILKRSIEYEKLPTKIKVCGDLSPKNTALLAREGASVFVLDRSNIFSKKVEFKTALENFICDIEKEKNLV